MKIFRRVYFIYPELQKPLLKQVALTFMVVSFLQSLFIFYSMKWLEHKIQADISIVVDYRVLGPWKTLLYVSVFFPLIINFAVTMAFVLVTSNKFAGPLFRLERDLDDYLLNKKDKINIKFRKDDLLIGLADKINLAVNQKE
jgi:hypothetical protein